MVDFINLQRPAKYTYLLECPLMGIKALAKFRSNIIRFQSYSIIVLLYYYIIMKANNPSTLISSSFIVLNPFWILFISSPFLYDFAVHKVGQD